MAGCETTNCTNQFDLQLELRWKMKTKKADAKDLEVGRRVRTMRILRHMSQTALGKILGITFQQIQKYENGKNRIAAGRLQRIGEIFEVPVSYFFGATDGKAADTKKIMDFLGTKHALRLLQAFDRIENHKMQRALVDLTEAIAQQR
jgi:transcriptional regulator with XRE-family HTH domain